MTTRALSEWELEKLLCLIPLYREESREVAGREIELVVSRYRRHLESPPPKPASAKEVSVELQRIGRAAIKLSADLVELGDGARDDLFTAYLSGQPRSETSPEVYASLAGRLRSLGSELEWLSETSELAEAYARRLRARDGRGRAPNTAARELADGAARVWERFSDVPLARGRNGRSPWERFLRALFEIVNAGSKSDWYARQLVEGLL